MQGGVEKPDLGIIVLEASGPGATSKDQNLTFSECGKISPIVAPVDQQWACKFAFREEGKTHRCSAVLAVRSDDHWGVWDDAGRVDQETGKRLPTLTCSR